MKQIKTTNAKASYWVGLCRPFKANNLEGIEIGNKYVVLSYGWYPLYIHKEGKWYANLDKYSVSTSKQSTQAHPRVPCIELTFDEMRALMSA